MKWCVPFRMNRESTFGPPDILGTTGTLKKSKRSLRRQMHAPAQLDSIEQRLRWGLFSDKQKLAGLDLFGAWIFASVVGFIWKISALAIPLVQPPSVHFLRRLFILTVISSSSNGIRKRIEPTPPSCTSCLPSLDIHFATYIFTHLSGSPWKNSELTNLYVPLNDPLTWVYLDCTG